ncbi:hypothetical protein P7K49_034311 [Saguinus oedipus]|uniref:Uncharacterized protein n=1 Tax=Saguinus oedipus TaxID=9490 RepID=A0ABQ9TUX2_SAGOE|nr:hypothetical protein P7K49_034311 [Saguinus oedipus]
MVGGDGGTRDALDALPGSHMHFYLAPGSWNTLALYFGTRHLAELCHPFGEQEKNKGCLSGVPPNPERQHPGRSHHFSNPAAASRRGRGHCPCHRHGISSLRLCLVSVCVVLSCPCVLDARPVCPTPCRAPTHHCPGPQTIVRGSKGAKDGALTLLLGEFENMSVTRSNSLRRDSPPPPARARQENGIPEEPAATARAIPGKAGSRGRIAGHSEAGGGSGDRRRAGPEKRPKSSREGSGDPQESSRDKRPLSGPDVGIPQPAGLASGAKLAAGRPFNTYPRADTDHPSRGAQVTRPPPQGPEVPCLLLPCPYLPAPPHPPCISS